MNNVQEYPVPCETSIDPVSTSPSTPMVDTTHAYHIEMNKISRLNLEPVRAAEQKEIKTSLENGSRFLANKNTQLLEFTSFLSPTL